jgi:hypothetical protein
MHTHHQSSDPVPTIGHDIGKNTFHLVGLNARGAMADQTRPPWGNPLLPARRYNSCLG